MTFTEIVKLDDYRAKPHPNPIIAANDREYCEQSTCPKCGGHGRNYRSFTKGIYHGPLLEYRFYAQCRNPRCGFAEEI